MDDRHDDRHRYLDEAIDRAARALTAGEPAPAFRTKVLARIADRREPRRWPWVLAPIALAASIVVGVVWSRGPAQPVHPPDAPIERNASASPAPPAPTPLSATDVPATDTRAATPSASRARVSMPESEVAALAPESLDVPSLGIAEIPFDDSLELQRLEPITPIVLTPIDEPEGDRP